MVKISTGAEAINELLGGGIETRSITEIFGEYRWGRGAAYAACMQHGFGGLILAINSPRILAAMQALAGEP